MRSGGRPARSTIALHWLVAGGVVFMLALGFYVSGLPRGQGKTDWVQIHKSFGMIVFLVIAMRILWRAATPFPEGPTAGWERVAARVAQWGLIAATLVAPLSGVVRSISYARPVQVFGVPVIPQLLAEKNEALNEIAGAIHDVAAWTLVVLIAVHAAGALKHAFVDRDDTLARMLPRRSQGTETAPR